MNRIPQFLPYVRSGLAAVLLLLPSIVLHAELGDRDKPVNIEADRLSVDDKKKESLFEGNVTMTQGTMVLKADRVFVRQDLDGYNYAVAYGRPAYFKQKREGVDEYVEGWSERMEYDGKQDKVQLFTNARVTKGTDEVRGDYISYDAVTEYYQVIGGGKAAATPTNPNGRVRAVIQPKRQPDQPGATPADKGATPAVRAPLKPSPTLPSER
ncbi:MAG TPA: lipopolysaccharide transport periplasmic protein LptA [Burkholderiales bacterium]|nr:lipopolysaccharide transport periplasmic protein LptA [Burkholderiales bacterium]